MRKDKLYFFTFLAISIIFTIIATIAVRYFVSESAINLLNTQLESSKREAKQMASIIGHELANGLNQEEVVENIQKSIELSNLEAGFISVLDWSSMQICHPDKKKIGLTVVSGQSFASSVDNEITSKDFYDLLKAKEVKGEILDFESGEQTSEVIYLFPVANSDWIIASHANLSKISNQIRTLRNRFYIIFIIMGFVTILLSVLTVRIIGSLYEKNLEEEKQKLESEVINLAKLNTALGEYQQKVTIEKPKLEVVNDKDALKKDTTDTGKKRILTYLRNELLPVSTDEIAYIYTENTITYVVCTNGKKSTTNTSLDELLSNLDTSYFYRANRQFIIAISSIEKIIRYGNNQLKIIIIPKSELDIIIGKNKAAEFKQWLNL